MGVVVELEKSNPRDVEADNKPTLTEESEVEQVTPEQVLRRSSRTSGHQIGIHLHYTIYC